MHGFTDADLEIQARAREFVDSVIPYEVEAEMNEGRLAPEVEAEHGRRAIALGLHATNMAKDVGGGGCTMLQQVLVQEQCGRATNALAWVMHTPPAWLAQVATSYQVERWVKPAVRGELHECYAITEEDAGSDVDALVGTARRDGDDYILDTVKWHVTDPVVVYRPDSPR